MKKIKTIKPEDVIVWLKTKRKGQTFSYLNCPACLLTLFIRGTMKHPKALVLSSGQVLKKDGNREYIAYIPFHNALWTPHYGTFLSLTRDEAIKRLKEIAYEH